MELRYVSRNARPPCLGRVCTVAVTQDLGLITRPQKYIQRRLLDGREVECEPLSQSNKYLPRYLQRYIPKHIDRVKANPIVAQ